MAALLLLPGLVACGVGARAETLTLGLLTYISEGSSQNAQDRQRAFHLAVAHLNQAGGVFGRPVEAVVADTKLNPDTAVAEARRLIEDEGVHAIVGPSTSANARPVAEQVAGPAGVARALNAVADGDQIIYQGASGVIDWNAHGDLRQGYVGIWRFTIDGQIEDVDSVPYQA